MKACIIVEHDQQHLKAANLHVVNAALAVAAEVDMLVMGYQCQNIAEDAAKITGVHEVLLADHEQYEHQLAENCGELVAQYAKDYDYLLAASSTFSKNLLPRVAALLDCSMVSDVLQIESANTFIRPMYAGNVLAKVQSEEAIKILTVRTSHFKAADKTPTAVNIKKISDVFQNDQSTFESQTLTKSKRPELTEAKIIISGGRGLKSSDNFKLLEKIADRLGAAIGASRAAVDAGFAPNDYQVGQTGKVVAPELYIAVGISGAIQHLAGMKDSKIIVAINNDPDAPIFQIADYRMVGDLFKILPELDAALAKVLPQEKILSEQ